MYYPKTNNEPMKPSYDPYGEEASENGSCGTMLSFEVDNSTNDKKEVSCKKCIRLFESADKEMKQINESVLKDMQGFVDFMQSQPT
jgi:hypothetical protein